MNESNYVPPPPAEVSIRTLASDLKSVSSSGGQPQFQNVRIPVIVSGTTTNEGSKKWFIFILGTLIIVAILVAVFVYVFIVSKRESPVATPAPQTNSVSNQVSSGTVLQNVVPPTSNVPIVNFNHTSYFKKPVEEILTFVAKRGATSASDLQTYSQKIINTVLGGSATSTFSEVVIKDEGGRPLSNYEFFSLLDGNVLDSQFLSTNFNPDFTYFVYHDKNGFWPGYILTLKPTQNWLFLKDDVKKLETSIKLQNLFLTSPGDIPLTGFADQTINGEDVRILNIPISGTAFLYDWTRNYLILSTSKDGFFQALNRL